MQHSSSINLYSTRDFTTFRFQIEEEDNSVGWQVRFNSHHRTRIYEVVLKPAGPLFSHMFPSNAGNEPGPNVGEMLLLTIDVYSERYPERVIFLKADTASAVRFYETLVQKFLLRLKTVFRIDSTPEISTEERNWGIPYTGFLLSRKPIPYLSLISVETVWKGRSRLFGLPVAVVVEKDLHLSSNLPR